MSILGARSAFLLLLLAGNLRASPNVVLISVDTLRADRLPAYGWRAIQTPHLDRLRADAVLFERAWSPTPLTAPAHASMLTGLLPAQHGIRDNSGFVLLRGVRTIAEELARRGYATGAFVSCAVMARPAGLARGFGTYDDAFAGPQRKGSDTLAVALRWLTARKQGPWLLFLHLYEPHTPYESMPGVANAYDAEVVRADRLTGTLLDELRRRKLYDDALIIFTSDHGEGLGDHVEREHGVLLHRETLQVPLIVKFPANRLRGRSVAADAQLIDIAPTILEHAGARPTSAPGLSLATLATAPRARTIYSETFYPRFQLAWHELRSVIIGNLHLIAGRRVEMYDLATDPGETTDLSDARRREVHPLLAALRQFSSPVASPSAQSVDARKLAALGYLSGGSGAEATFHPDPRDRIRILTPVLRLTTTLRREQYEAALEITEEILATHPQFVEIWERKAMALLGLGRDEEAKEAAAEAVRRGRP